MKAYSFSDQLSVTGDRRSADNTESKIPANLGRLVADEMEWLPFRRLLLPLLRPKRGTYEIFSST